MVSQELAKVFAGAWNYDKGRKCNPCCTIAHFRIDLLGTARSPWNKSAAKVFSEDFVRHHGLEPTTALIEDIEDAFHTRIKSLKEKSKRHHLNAAQSHQETRKDRQHVRKSTVIITSHCRLWCLPHFYHSQLFHRRFEVAQMNPSLQKHVPLLQRLGVEGMSSDESENDDLTKNPRFFVLSPRWRAKELSTWLRMFDSLYMIERRSGGDGRGAYPRLRIYKSPQSFSRSTRFVPGLPVNTYDPSWLARQADADRYVRQNKEEHYDFSCDIGVLK
jgi:hypothetical protein